MAQSGKDRAPRSSGAATGVMLSRARQDQILAHLHQAGSVRVSELGELLGVSDMTVRRDLDVLAAQRRLEKVHGGAVLTERRADEPGFEAKQHRESAEKRAIARGALPLVRPGSSIALSAGTTTWALAQVLARTPGLDLTILTNSANVWMTFQQEKVHDSRVILSGGMFRTPSDALVGPIADAAIRSLYVDMLFLGVHGMDPDAGFTTPNPSEAETNRTMISRSRQLVVLADHTKWRTIGLCAMAPLSAASVIVSDERLSEQARGILREQVGRVVVSDVDDSTEGAVSAFWPAS